MSILGSDLPDARILDLCAGSGALGLEALSRGARSAEFVDRDPRALAAVRTNIVHLGVEDVAVVTRQDAVQFAGGLPAGAYDVVFADPPYESDMVDRLIALFRAVPFGGILSVEHPAALGAVGDETRRYGSTAISFSYAP